MSCVHVCVFVYCIVILEFDVESIIAISSITA